MIVFHGRIIGCFAFGVDGCAHTGPCVCCSGCPDATFPCMIKHPHFSPLATCTNSTRIRLWWNSVVAHHARVLHRFLDTKHTTRRENCVSLSHYRPLFAFSIDGCAWIGPRVSWVARMPHSTQNGTVCVVRTHPLVFYVWHNIYSYENVIHIQCCGILISSATDSSMGCVCVCAASFRPPHGVCPFVRRRHTGACINFLCTGFFLIHTPNPEQQQSKMQQNGCFFCILWIHITKETGSRDRNIGQKHCLLCDCDGFIDVVALCPVNQFGWWITQHANAVHSLS